jgi:hypothetical protein
MAERRLHPERTKRGLERHEVGLIAPSRLSVGAVGVVVSTGSTDDRA